MLTTLFLGLYSLKKFTISLNKVELDASGDVVLSVSVEKMKRRMFSNLNLLIGVLAGVFYVWISLRLNFVLINAVGIFALFTLFIAIILSVLILMNYIYLIFFLKRISKKKVSNVHPFFIDKNKWLTEINSTAIYTRNIFFVLVSFMVMVFVIFSPRSLWSVLLNSNSTTEVYLPAMLYIGSVLVYDLLVLPILSIFQFIFTKQIVKRISEMNMKKYLDELYNVSLDENYKYLNAIEVITKMSEEFISNSKKKFTPIATYIFNAIAVASAIIINATSLYQTFFSSLNH